ncbi:MAG: hypothetical protein AAB874_07305, partial [Patescibacteria group bacterium]
MREIKLAGYWVGIFLLGSLSGFFWLSLLLGEIGLDFSTLDHGIRSFLVFCIPLLLTTLTILGVLSRKKNPGSTKGLAFIFSKFGFQIVFILFLSNIGILATWQFLTRAAGTCISAQQIFADTKCYLLYYNGTGYKAYNPSGT